MSVLTRKVDAGLTAWRERKLTAVPYRALMVDARIEQVRGEGHVRATAALWVVGGDARTSGSTPRCGASSPTPSSRAASCPTSETR